MVHRYASINLAEDDIPNIGKSGYALYSSFQILAPSAGMSDPFPRTIMEFTERFSTNETCVASIWVIFGGPRGSFIASLSNWCYVKHAHTGNSWGTRAKCITRFANIRDISFCQSGLQPLITDNAEC